MPNPWYLELNKIPIFSLRSKEEMKEGKEGGKSGKRVLSLGQNKLQYLPYSIIGHL